METVDLNETEVDICHSLHNNIIDVLQEFTIKYDYVKDSKIHNIIVTVIFTVISDYCVELNLPIDKFVNVASDVFKIQSKLRKENANN